jgi:DNA polymerase I-like protein with 3'-5' exonuclease and polymerase domains
MSPTHDAVQDALTVFAGRLVGHNSRFDEAFLKQAGFDTGPQWDDSYILHHLTYPLDYHGLKSVAGQMYGPAARAGEKWLESVKRKNRWDWATVPVDHPAYWGYAAFDCCLTARIWNDMNGAAFRDDGAMANCYQRELRVARLMAEVAERGMRVDMKYTRDLLDKWAVEALHLADRLNEYQIEKPGSSAQIAAALANEG